MFNVASIQLNISDDRSKNEQVAFALAKMDEARDAELILLPETWSIGYLSFDLYNEQSETLDGPTMSALAEKAKELNSYVYAGSFVEKNNGKLYNTAVLLDNSGKQVAVYRKMHLFGYGSKEKELLTPGEEVVTVQTDLGKFGLSICYDLRFPELYRRQMENGTEIFLLTAAWPFPRISSWQALNQARAMENLCYLVSCNCSGINRGHQFAGHSQVVDPWGVVRAGSAEQPCIVRSQLDTEYVKQVRAEFPPLEDRMLRSV